MCSSLPAFCILLFVLLARHVLSASSAFYGPSSPLNEDAVLAANLAWKTRECLVKMEQLYHAEIRIHNIRELDVTYNLEDVLDNVHDAYDMEKAERPHRTYEMDLFYLQGDVAVLGADLQVKVYPVNDPWHVRREMYVCTALQHTGERENRVIVPGYDRF